MKKTASPVIVLEVDQTSRHRIVLLAADGSSRTGDWCATTEVATLEDKFWGRTAHAVLPSGVWTLREVTHQVLA